MTFCYEFCDLEIFAFAAKIAAFYYLSAKRGSMKFTKSEFCLILIVLYSQSNFVFAMEFLLLKQ